MPKFPVTVAFLGGSILLLTALVVPSRAIPTGAVPTGAVPTGAVPTGAVPTGAVPTGVVNANLSAEAGQPQNQMDAWRVDASAAFPAPLPRSISQPDSAIPQPASAYDMRSDEIRLRGWVQAFDVSRRQLSILVTEFALPSGRSCRLGKNKVKTVLLSNSCRLRRADGVETHLPTIKVGTEVGIEVGTAIAVIGFDAGTGEPLRARTVTEDSRLDFDLAVKPVRLLEWSEIQPAKQASPLRGSQPTVPLSGTSLYSVTKMVVEGSMSTFGGPFDTGVRPDEGLALANYGALDTLQPYFLPAQPPGTTGLARRLNPDAFYLACRWDYTRTPRNYLSNILVTVTNPLTGRTVRAKPIDYGPHQATGRVADLSPGLARALGLRTNDRCRVEIPLP